jgi:DNA-binding HxlR family transcriptional regulator
MRFEATPMAKRLPKQFNCPTEFTLAVLGGKWKTVILCYLKEQPCRYTDLRKLLPALSDKMLTERLGDLMASGLIARRRLPNQGKQIGSKEVYVLTGKGSSLGKLLRDLYAWGRDHAAIFDVQVGEPLKELRFREESRSRR